MSDPNSLCAAVEKKAECAAQFKEEVRVVETFKGDLIWDGPVSIFTLDDHPKASVAYGWSTPTAIGQCHWIALGIPPVNSPADAIRAHIFVELRQSTA